MDVPALQQNKQTVSLNEEPEMKKAITVKNKEGNLERKKFQERVVIVNR